MTKEKARARGNNAANEREGDPQQASARKNPSGAETNLVVKQHGRLPALTQVGAWAGFLF